MTGKRQDFKWTPGATAAALALAEGLTREQAAARADISERTLYRWLADEDFSAEVDRLTLMAGIASRAERLRIAQRVARQMIGDDGTIKTDRDLLDWLKYAQSETTGIKLGLTALTAEFNVQDCTDDELELMISGATPEDILRRRRRSAKPA